jgi:phosphoenolpyruvate carboxykinase (GTP)
VLKWMLERVEGKDTGEEHVFGVTPAYEDLTWDGLDFTRDQFRTITAIEPDQWRQEFKLHDELFERLEARLPPELRATKAALEARLKAEA